MIRVHNEEIGVYLYIHIYIYIYYIHMCTRTYVYRHMQPYTCMHVCVYINMCVCVYIKNIRSGILQYSVNKCWVLPATGGGRYWVYWIRGSSFLPGRV